MPVVSSLQQNDLIADRIRFHIQSDSRPVLVVEGETDERMVTRAIGERWAIFPAETRDKVPAVVDEAIELGVKKIAGLIDRDFDDFYKSRRESGCPIFSFPEADLEASLVQGRWCLDLIDELGSSSKIKTQGGSVTLQERAICIAGVIGVLRKANANYHWGLNFDDLKIYQKIKNKDLSFSSSSLISAVYNQLNQAEHRQQCNVLKSEIESQHNRGVGSFRGRDALLVIITGLRSLYGNRRLAAEHVEDIASTLRLSVKEEFCSVSPMPELIEFLSDQSN